ncbi:hypothetical protein TWF481_011603 [Arthrobotrys musiformis]|uniref:F-box domain-containing protein n=1 Tax=Arthrobotrys musiformis TaxID=47236 RepID=A0AAV9VZ16_9PEZI
MITDIAIEVLNEILSYIPAFDPSQGDLLACCLVSKFFNSIATPALYRHPLLRISPSGFKEHLVSCLLTKRYNSHRFIRHISIKWDRVHDDSPHTWAILFPPDANRAAIHIAAFIESLPPGQLQSIHCESMDTLKYLPSAYHPSIRSLECVPREQLPSAPFLPSLTSLTLQELKPHLQSTSPDLAICHQYQHQLKSLSLKCRRMRNRRADPQLPSRPTKHFDFRGLERLSIRDARDLAFTDSSVFRPMSLKSIKKLELIDCHIPPAILVPQASNFTNLTDLAIYPKFNTVSDTYSGLDISNLLLNLPSLLQSLHWTIFSQKVSEYPSKNAIRRHSQTLRKLWLESSYPSPDRSERNQNLRGPHYSDEFQFRMLEVPLKVIFEEGLDLETLARFPRLEHLALPVEPPNSRYSWISSFPKLRSFYLVNSCKVYCDPSRRSTKRFRQEWCNWFMSAYDANHPDSDPDYPLTAVRRHPNLQLVAFQRPSCNWENREGHGAPEPGSRGFTANLRDPDNSGNFSKEVITSETVRRLYPEVWDFYKGYFIVESERYVRPRENTNVAKGVFEDEDELEDLPPSFGFGNHALQDYQMQLMLLEQQNKRRLMIARAEQDALQECPIEQPTPVVVHIPPWNIEKDPEVLNGEQLPPSSLTQSPQDGQGESALSGSPSPPVVKSLQEYQNDFIFYDDQMSKRYEYAAQATRAKVELELASEGASDVLPTPLTLG